MINKDWGGGAILRFYGGDTAVMREIELMGVPPVFPPTRENPAGSRVKLLPTLGKTFGP